MSEETTDASLRGDAAWKAHLAAIEKRNSAAKTKAANHKSQHDVATAARESRLARVEEGQLEALNQRLAASRDSQE